MNAPAVRYCPTCEQPWPRPDKCATCSHSVVLHNLAGDGKTRTACSEFSPPGRCGCRKFEPAEVPDAR